VAAAAGTALRAKPAVKADAASAAMAKVFIIDPRLPGAPLMACMVTDRLTHHGVAAMNRA
jgi:hypothetical protein